MDTVDQYLAGLKQAYNERGGKAEWDRFEQVKEGATKEDLEKIKALYPDTPATLLALLEFADGTYWRQYKGEKIIPFFLGSDVFEYPYYLLSSRQVIDFHDSPLDFLVDCIQRKYEFVEVDEKITNQPAALRWMHFSDCMNNGGTSQLFIDFSPSDKGTKGQVVRYLHDPDGFKVIASSFEEYLVNLTRSDFPFIQDYMFE